MTNKCEALKHLSEEDYSEARVIKRNNFRYIEDGISKWRLHMTDIVTFDPQRKVWTLDSGGWRTNTTKEKMNEYSPFSIYQEKGIWYVTFTTCESDSDKPVWEREKFTTPYWDGIEIEEVVGGVYHIRDKSELANASAEVDRIVDTTKKINRLVNKIDTKHVPKPSSGDCFVCQMKFNEMMNNKGVTRKVELDCLDSHLEEGYLHGSLLGIALLTWYHPDQLRTGMVWGIDPKKRLRNFLKIQCGIGC